MHKILILFCFFICEVLCFAAAESSMDAEPLSQKTDFRLEVFDDDAKILIPSPTAFKGFFTKGLGPCFAIMVSEKSTGHPIALSHLGPQMSYASVIEAQRYFEEHLGHLLYNIEQIYKEENESRFEEEEEEKHLLYDLINIQIIGGQFPDSSNTIEAIKEITKEQFYPIISYYLGFTKNDEVADVYFQSSKKINIRVRKI